MTFQNYGLKQKPTLKPLLSRMLLLKPRLTLKPRLLPKPL